MSQSATLRVQHVRTKLVAGLGAITVCALVGTTTILLLSPPSTPSEVKATVPAISAPAVPAQVRDTWYSEPNEVEPAAPLPAAVTAPLVVADRQDERASGLSAPEQADAPAIYELTVGGGRCSFARVDSVPAVRPPNHIYGYGPDLAEVSAQLCPGAPR
jgi:hypothetical protein